MISNPLNAYLTSGRMNKFFEQTKKAANKARQAGISNLNAASTALSSASGTNIHLTTAKTDEELKRILTETPILFAGNAWKRRGGLGKLASYSSAWENRYLQLRGSVLLYFDADPAKALSSSNDLLELLRGYIDLAQEKASVQVSFGHSGAPSPFCLSIKVQVGLAQETKWKLCLDHHQAQMEWLAVISDVTIQCSVDSYNRALLDAANPSSHGLSSSDHAGGSGFMRAPPVYEPGAKDRRGGGPNCTSPTRNSFQLVDSPHQLWMMDNYTLERKTTQSEEQQRKAKASVDTALQVMERLLSDERNRHAMSSRKVKELESQLEETRQAKEECEEKLKQALADKQSLESELSIRISTHSLGEEGSSAKNDDNDALKSQIDILQQMLESKSASLRQAEEELESTRTELEQRVAELETKLVILQSEHDELLQKQTKHLNGTSSTEPLPTPTSADDIEQDQEGLRAQVADLEEQLTQAKMEYQQSLQELAADFARNLQLAEQKYSIQADDATDDSTAANGDEQYQTLRESPSEDSTEFKDCVEAET